MSFTVGQTVKISAHKNREKAKCHCRTGRITVVYTVDTENNKEGDARGVCNHCGTGVYFSAKAVPKRNSDQAVSAARKAVKKTYPTRAKSAVLKSAVLNNGVWTVRFFVNNFPDITVHVPLVQSDMDIRLL